MYSSSDCVASRSSMDTQGVLLRLLVGVAWEEEVSVNVGYKISFCMGSYPTASGFSHLRLCPFRGGSAPRKISGENVRYVLVSTVRHTAI